MNEWGDANMDVMDAGVWGCSGAVMYEEGWKFRSVGVYRGVWRQSVCGCQSEGDVTCVRANMYLQEGDATHVRTHGKELESKPDQGKVQLARGRNRHSRADEEDDGQL